MSRRSTRSGCSWTRRSLTGSPGDATGPSTSTRHGSQTPSGDCSSAAHHTARPPHGGERNEQRPTLLGTTTATRPDRLPAAARTRRGALGGVLRSGVRMVGRTGFRKLRITRHHRPVDDRAGAGQRRRSGRVDQRRRPRSHASSRRCQRRHRAGDTRARRRRAVARGDRRSGRQPDRRRGSRPHGAVTDLDSSARRRGIQPLVPAASRPAERPRRAALRAAALRRTARAAAAQLGDRTRPRTNRRPRRRTRQRRPPVVRRGRRLRRRCRTSRGSSARPLSCHPDETRPQARATDQDTGRSGSKTPMATPSSSPAPMARRTNWSSPIGAEAAEPISIWSESESTGPRRRWHRAHASAGWSSVSFRRRRPTPRALRAAP